MVDAGLYAELQALCRRALPERLDQRISQIEPLGAASSPHVTFRLSWREGRQPRVERLLLYRSDRGAVRWAGPQSESLQRAWQVMRWLFGLGLPVPHVYTIQEGGEFLLLAHPEGEPLFPVAGTDPAAFIAALAKLLAGLHHLPPPEPVRGVLDDASRERVLAQIGQAARAADNGTAMEFVSELEIQMEAYPPCVVHGDPWSAHVYRDARGITALLGWENAALGDPRWDVACLAQELRAHHAGALIDPLCRAYTDHSGRTLDHMPYWEALVALHTWMCAGQTTDRALQGREHTRQALERWRAAVMQAAAAK